MIGLCLPRKVNITQRSVYYVCVCVSAYVCMSVCLLPSATKLRRLCFHRRVSVHRGVCSGGDVPGPGGGVCSRGRGVAGPREVCFRGCEWSERCAWAWGVPGPGGAHSQGDWYPSMH